MPPESTPPEFTEAEVTEAEFTEAESTEADVMRWSVALVADGDRPMTREEIVELADAVAPLGGVASGIGTSSYGAQIVVAAPHRDAAVAAATAAFRAAAAAAGLPAWPLGGVETISEAEDELADVFAEDDPSWSAT